jgi:phospholipase/carboxylesterase
MEPIEIETAPNPRASLIVIHGLGADGNDLAPLAEELDLRAAGAVRFVLPHAPKRAVTINGGYWMRAWYDIFDDAPARREDETGLRESQQIITALIDRERERGIEPGRIVLMGFSQGCAMTLQTGLRYGEKLAGLAGLSGYLPLAPTLERERHPANQSTPIFLAHGRGDPLIPIARAETTAAELARLGYAVEWHEYNMPHSLCAEEIEDLNGWLIERLKEERVTPPA